MKYNVNRRYIVYEINLYETSKKSNKTSEAFFTFVSLFFKIIIEF